VATATGRRLAFTCVWCGKPVTLLETDTGDEIPDAHAFLEQHAECLRHTQPPPADENAIVLPR